MLSTCIALSSLDQWIQEVREFWRLIQLKSSNKIILTSGKGVYSWDWSFESVIEPTTGLTVAKVTGARPMKKEERLVLI